MDDGALVGKEELDRRGNYDRKLRWIGSVELNL